ncbi:hypothetical protein TRM7557_03110 [Tritonibacter multivorans]|uniref:Uncharacterized protein n=1 Tax=Tritonibacter multivorans TaxID=928856 RepID=A0A0P1GH58_9RHOB|nr:hypothetical protein [Tritonibacter multivorans]MDA7422760.1 hypothetical protein [Tritonibacter multivorans]CUH80861.1 hypothetical protein TRM7557_03110 [Tritonibacter multivorans]SFD56795.1 hypothetical protein SAMN04488049_11658 [Tritonibacter multivorans]
MLKVLKSCILAVSLIAAPLAANALAVPSSSSLPDTRLVAHPASLQNGDTYNLSDGNEALFLLGLRTPRTRAGSFTLTIVNDFVHAGTFEFGNNFFVNTLNNATFSLGTDIVSATGPFSLVMDPGETLVFTLEHDATFFATGILSSFSSTTTVPLPPAMLLLLSAIGAGWAVRRRARKSEDATALQAA